MLKISNKVSIALSLILCVAVAGICCGCAVILPGIIDQFYGVHDYMTKFVPIIADLAKPVILGLAYTVVALVLVADLLLTWLLLRVREGLVFTAKSVALIRGVSWCCVGICLCFAFIGLKFSLGFVVACLALFLGLCLRVVKNVIAEAIIIKSENDLTV